MTYASVNGLQLYYETRGTGRPLVLPHGGLMTIDLIFGPLLEPLAASRQVIAVELQGHGHTHRLEIGRRRHATPTKRSLLTPSTSTCSRPRTRPWCTSSRDGP